MKLEQFLNMIAYLLSGTICTFFLSFKMIVIFNAMCHKDNWLLI